MLRKAMLILVLSLMAFSPSHKFYVSVSHVTYAEKEDALQITTRIFTDDLDQLLEERYGLTAQLGTELESTEADAYLEKYLRSKFTVRINGNTRDFDFIGKKADNDVMVCYMELPNIGFQHLNAIEIQNEVLHDLFEDQQNVVHITVQERKKSFVLVRGSAKGLLNL
ncbi:DUF6702 family protein [Arenibacter sp. GZD96]|uniref:DUF6702 family protein n=1 Tax=Aurantibrevibacter litoralis TaxID=3106030 RepID=UPI002AFF7181|nr:DUF6702 family protein [Arenibacter sp. GZD-96]MEA1786694.1 DUF6702 family protein [Arenibacter sp. GZD-96]